MICQAPSSATQKSFRKGNISCGCARNTHLMHHIPQTCMTNNKHLPILTTNSFLILRNRWTDVYDDGYGKLFGLSFMDDNGSLFC